jgi:hypothetical protein
MFSCFGNAAHIMEMQTDEMCCVPHRDWEASEFELDSTSVTYLAASL